MSYDVAQGWKESPCPHCGGNQALAVAVANGIKWLRCVTCFQGAVDNNGTISPATMPMRDVENLPAEDESVWQEARVCLGSGAYMASVGLCRKLLLHVAAANALPIPPNGRTPGFVECVEHLVTAGVITPNMKKWVDPIKDIGNAANHEIKAVTQEEAEKVARFTEQLLVIAYELQAP